MYFIHLNLSKHGYLYLIICLDLRFPFKDWIDYSFSKSWFLYLFQLPESDPDGAISLLIWFRTRFFPVKHVFRHTLKSPDWKFVSFWNFPKFRKMLIFVDLFPIYIFYLSNLCLRKIVLNKFILNEFSAKHCFFDIQIFCWF